MTVSSPHLNDHHSHQIAIKRDVIEREIRVMDVQPTHLQHHVMEDVNIWLEWKEMWDIAPLLVSNVYFFLNCEKTLGSDAFAVSKTKSDRRPADRHLHPAYRQRGKLRFFLHMQPTVEGTVCHVVLT